MRKVRKDTGQRHKAYTHGGKKVCQYDLAGKLERKYDSLQDAVAQNDVGAIYQGILYCCQGKIRKHCNKIWKFDKEVQKAIDLEDKI